MKETTVRRIYPVVASSLKEISTDQLGRALSSPLPNFLCLRLLDRYLKTMLRVFPPS
jgi:hypothetical protein